MVVLKKYTGKDSFSFWLIPTILGSSDRLSSGPTAYTTSFLVESNLADEIVDYAEGQKFHTLKFEYPNDPPAYHEKLYFLGVKPVSDPYFKRIYIADRRYFWGQGSIRRA